MEDEGKLPVGIRFFKVLIPGFEQALKLPPIISMILNDGDIPEAAFLVSSRGTWKVGVGVGEFSNNDNYQGLVLTGKGWDSFVKSHDLSVGYFLVFEHSGDMHFKTLVFDSTTLKSPTASLGGRGNARPDVPCSVAGKSLLKKISSRWDILVSLKSVAPREESTVL